MLSAVLETAGVPDVVVTTAADVVDANDGVTSLREAIEAVNESAPVTEQTFPDLFIPDDPSLEGDFFGTPLDVDPVISLITFDASLSQETITLDSDLPELIASATIAGDLDGDGTPDITVNGNGNSVLNVSGNGNVFVVDGITINDGFSTTGGAALNVGSDVTVTVRDSRFENNTTSGSDTLSRGGAIQLGENSTLTVEGSSILGNEAVFGGGIALANSPNSFFNSATINVIDSNVSGNSADVDGGAVAAYSSFGSQVNVSNSLISSNTAGGNAGGIGAASINLTDNAIVDGNQAGGDGGGLNGAFVRLENSVVSGNSAVNGGGINTYYADLISSTVLANNASEDGGGINSVGGVTAINGTIANNRAGGDGGGISVTSYSYAYYGGEYYGDYFGGGSANLINSTVTGNSADALGGGIQAEEVQLTNSIVLGNGTPDSLSSPEIFVGSVSDGVLTSGNLSATDSIVGANSAAFDATGVSGVVNADPTAVFASTVSLPQVGGTVIAGEVVDNVGGVPTVALLASASNPALDIGDATLNVLGSPVGGPTDDVFLALGNVLVDALGNTRDVDLAGVNNGGTVDAGAVELQTLTDAPEDPNAAPIITSDGGDTAAISIVENTTAVTDVVASDDNAGVTFSLSTTNGGGADNGLFTVDPATGELTFTAAPDFENPADTDGDNVFEVQVTATDAGGLTDSQDITVNVTDEATVLSFDFAVVEIFSIPENLVLNGIIARLGDTSGELTVTFASSDTSEATAPTSVTLADGEVSAAVPITTVDDFIQDGGQFVTLTASAPGLNDSSIILLIIDDDVAPEIAGGDTTAVSVAESTTFVADVDASDDVEGVTFSLSTTDGGGADNGQFTIDSTTGELTFTAAPDFENPADVDGDNVFDVQVTATDAGGLTDSQDITVTVTDEAAVLSLTFDESSLAEGGSLTGTLTRSGDTTGVVNVALASSDTSEIIAPGSLFLVDGTTSQTFTVTAADDSDLDGDQAVTLTASLAGADDATFVLTVLDDEVAPEIAGGDTASVSIEENTTFVADIIASDDGGVTFSLSTTDGGGADNGVFSIDSTTGELTFTAAPDFENPADADGDNVFEVQVTATDAGGLTDSQDVTVTVTDELPVFSSTFITSISENSTATGAIVRTGGDESGDVTLTLTSSDTTELTVPATVTLAEGETTTTIPLTAERDSIQDGDQTVTLTIDGPGFDNQTISVTIFDVNETPEIAGGDAASASVEENTTFVADIDASDDGGVTFSLSTTDGGGADNGLFTIDPVTGELTFTAAPDFENPADADGDNVFEVQVTVTDAGGLTDVQGITVTVTDETLLDILPEADSLIVTTTDDVVDEFDNLTSLREAIAVANNQAGVDTITFASDAGDAFANGGLIRLTQGELLATEALNIDASGVTGGDLVITGDANGDDVTLAGTDITDVAASFAGTAGDATDLLDDNSRVLNILRATETSTLTGLTITGGRTTTDDFLLPFGTEGGGIRVDNNVRLLDEEFSLSDAELVISESTIAGNSTTGVGGNGGGISGNFVTVTDSNVFGNSTSGQNAIGGGIYGFDGVTVINSTVSGNSTSGETAFGGGIGGGNFFFDGVTVINSTVSNNSTSGDISFGGGIFGISTTLINSTVSGNSTNGESASGGGVFAISATLISSTVSGNSISGDFDTGVFYDGLLTGGGGIFGLVTTVTNSTVSGNSTSGNIAVGGGISGGIVLLNNSTVSGNSTSGTSAYGGGIFANATSTVTNSIVLGNTTAGSTNYVDNELASYALLANGGNIIGANATAFDASVSDNIINADPTTVFDSTQENSADSSLLAGTLADNGGATQTIALAANALNPALDAGDDDVALNLSIFEGSNDAVIFTGFNVDNVVARPLFLEGFARGFFEEEVLGVDINGDGDTLGTFGNVNDLNNFGPDGSPIELGPNDLIPFNFSTIAFTDDFVIDQRGIGFDRPIDQTFVANNGVNTVDLGAVELQTQVAAPNTAPVITSDGGDAAAISIAENTTAVTDVVASDDDAGVTFSLTTTDGGGADNGLFSVDSATGVLEFTAAPDFENPADADGDNVFEVQVTATDAGGLTDLQDISVSVTDVATVVTLTVDSSSLSEDGTGATATLTRSGDTSGIFVATLSSSDPAEVALPATVTLADGETSTTFDLTAADDGEADGDQTVTITVSAAGVDDVAVDVTVVDTTPVVVEPIFDIATSGDDELRGSELDDVLVGGLGSDTFFGSAGDDVFITDAINGDNGRNDRDVINLGDIDANDIGNDVITDFDTDNFDGGENNFDTLEFTFAGRDFTISTGEDIAEFVAFLESDGDNRTDALIDGDDVLFVFTRDADDPNIITNSLLLRGVANDDGLTNDVLEDSSIDERSSNELDILAVDGQIIIGDDSGTTLTGGSADDTLIGGLGNDTLNGGAGNDVLTGGQVDGGSGRFEQNIFAFGDVDANDIGNDVITDFDTNNFRGGERNFDTVTFTFGGVERSLSTGKDFLDFINFLGDDGDDDTDVLRDGDDLIFVFGRNEAGFITNSIRFNDLAGDDGLTNRRLNRSSALDLGESEDDGKFDIFV